MTCTRNVSEICVTRGSSKTLRLTVKDEAGAAVNLSGASIYFSVAAYAGSTPFIVKTTDDILQIDLFDPPGGRADIFLVPSDTADLNLSTRYVFDVWVKLTSGKRYPVIDPSPFTVESGVTVVT